VKHLKIEKLGPIVEANIELGDLTVLVGPQASGKSLFVQLLKAYKDRGAIRRTLTQYGFDWLKEEDALQRFNEIYFGGGMRDVWSEQSVLEVDKKKVKYPTTVARARSDAPKRESVFLIPAQRVLALQDGWPKPFMGFDPDTPYALRHFSESLRRLMAQGFGSSKAIFPQSRRLKEDLRKLVDSAVYIGSRLEFETVRSQKRLVLRPAQSGTPLPYGAWSAGQREFTPLLMGLYWLMPPRKKAKHDEIEIVVIEEPEMGLHPKAVLAFGLLVLELMHRGYRVVVSTHSPVLLDLVWAMQELQGVHTRGAINTLEQIFDLSASPQTKSLLGEGIGHHYRTYYFSQTDEGVKTEDISTLDPGDENENISGWGGLSGFSGRIAEAVGAALASEAS